MEYKIDFKHQFRSFRECLVILGLSFLPLILVPFFNIPVVLFVICLLSWLILSVGLTLPIHINYLINNRGTRLIIDDKSDVIKVVHSGKEREYLISDIEITRYIGAQHKTGSYIPIPFNYYGYLRVRTMDNHYFYLTSLMIDPFKPPIPIHKTYYCLPIIW